MLSSVASARSPVLHRFMTPEALQARVLYRDADILIIDKPAGLAVKLGWAHEFAGVGRSALLANVGEFLDHRCRASVRQRHGGGRTGDGPVRRYWPVPALRRRSGRVQ